MSHVFASHQRPTNLSIMLVPILDKFVKPLFHQHYYNNKKTCTFEPTMHFSPKKLSKSVKLEVIFLQGLQQFIATLVVPCNGFCSMSQPNYLPKQGYKTTDFDVVQHHHPKQPSLRSEKDYFAILNVYFHLGVNAIVLGEFFVNN